MQPCPMVHRVLYEEAGRQAHRLTGVEGQAGYFVQGVYRVFMLGKNTRQHPTAPLVQHLAHYAGRKATMERWLGGAI